MATTQPMSPAARRYMRRLIPLFLLYVVVLFASLWAIRAMAPTGPLLWALAVAPALPLVGCIVVMGLYLIEEKDEFQRTVLAEAMLWGIGAVLTVTTVWGFLENARVLPHFQTYLAFPLFCGAQGLAQAFIRRRYR
ncbi:MAG: hypothetical protein K0R83_2814 [Caulobacter sp.]|jgi:uncharacterized YccA/Bax inhibitor family protein|nr:hypothetical protein [Caulobacter sp.]